MKYKYDVFISYSRRDYVDESYNVIPGNAIAEIQNVFDENGITYWFDKDGIYSGQEFIEIITGAIAESKMLIFISSKHSNESMWTAGEIFEALDGEKAIIPVKIDNSQYNKKFKLLIRPLDYIDYQENPQNALKDLLRAINKVKEDIAQKQREEEKLRQEKEAEAKKHPSPRRRKLPNCDNATSGRNIYNVPEATPFPSAYPVSGNRLWTCSSCRTCCSEIPCAPRNSPIHDRGALHSGQSRFRGEPEYGLCRRNGYLCVRRDIWSTWRNIQCATLDNLCPTGCPTAKSGSAL